MSMIHSHAHCLWKSAWWISCSSIHFCPFTFGPPYLHHSNPSQSTVCCPPRTVFWVKSKCPMLSTIILSHALSSYLCIIQSSACDWSNSILRTSGALCENATPSKISLKSNNALKMVRESNLKMYPTLSIFYLRVLQFSLLRLLFLTRIELDRLPWLQDNLAIVSFKAWNNCLVYSSCLLYAQLSFIHCIVLSEIQTLQKRKHLVDKPTHSQVKLSHCQPASLTLHTLHMHVQMHNTNTSFPQHTVITNNRYYYYM